MKLKTAFTVWGVAMLIALVAPISLSAQTTDYIQKSTGGAIAGLTNSILFNNGSNVDVLSGAFRINTTTSSGSLGKLWLGGGAMLYGVNGSGTVNTNFKFWLAMSSSTGTGYINIVENVSGSDVARNLIINESGGKVRIGSSTAPTEMLDVTGNGKFSGSVGIGVTPTQALDVVGNGKFTTSGSGWDAATIDAGQVISTKRHRVFLTPYLNNDSYNDLTQSGDLGIFFSDGIGTSGVNSAAGFMIAPHSTNTEAGIRITADGDVGIGTSCPPSKLAVEGTITAREVVVEATTWCDYVFKPEYKLRPLNEVAKFITLNGHLPEVPSEKEVMENGIKLGEMDAILLKKIEELTLYTIELQKEVEALKNQNTGTNNGNH